MVEAFTLEEFVGFVEAQEFAVIATVSSAGKPEAALVHVVVTADGELIIDSHVGSRKVANLSAHPPVALVIGWEAGVSYQIEGDARVVSGDERARYAARYTERFPDSNATDPTIDVTVVRPNWVRKCDAAAYPAVMVEASWL